ncbi:hypothetical protein GCM10008090_17030 [Arenicella chitinivorans]|uniref:CSLREA domain-containing protein n=1 Tax=Arenicella chitinivorans TaxID=1329800 RepID=A0A918RQY7_9GAMM|nr:choice-of-anchor Q domain-containing protein [Arenicella chitinivorans]GHA07797.1 hypothetical protein GCM10008090_17030 [Arenicella chitinivorans]
MNTTGQYITAQRNLSLMHGLLIAVSLTLGLLVTTSNTLAATIHVVALPGAPGCDLVDAINSANTDSAVGGCAAGTDGLDTILFSPFFSRYELSAMAYSHPSRGSSATPEIESEIRIVGPGDRLLEIARTLSADSIRLFTVAYNGDLQLENLSLQDWRQSGGFDGGTIRVAGELSMTNVEITGSAASYGGAIWVQSGDAVIRNSLLQGNSAGQSGGAIGLAANSSVTILDSTVSGNSATEGAGVSLGAAPNAQLSIFNSTITENTALSIGGGITLFTPFVTGQSQGNSVIIRNTIIAGNSAAEGAEVVFISPGDAQLMDLSHNILGTNALSYGDATNSPLFVGNDNQLLTSDYHSTALRSIIGPLQDNGGNTMTHALAANSPAIDAGLPFKVSVGFPFAVIYYHTGCRGSGAELALSLGDYRADQRGVERPLGDECDIGAYEAPAEDACFVVKAVNNHVLAFCL